MTSMKNNDWKDRLNVVYSTNPDFGYEMDNDEEQVTLDKDKQNLRVSIDKKNRGGKVVTLITGFVGTENDLKELGKLLLHLLVPIAIIHVQGDDGTAIIYGIIGCSMMFAAGLSWKYILAAVSAAGAAVAVAFAFFSDKIGKGYQWYRILAVIDPENTTGWAPNEATWKNIIYQQQRGEIAIGSGGIFGNGLFGGRFYSVPNAHNDFILSWMGNAIGFVGLCIVLGVLLTLVIKTFATGARSEDLLGSYICAGIGGALMAQIAVNVGMNLRVLPVIGVTLPFYSAGGSSVLMLYICVGLVLSVYMHNTKSLFG